MRWKIFQWMKFLFRHYSNSRKLSRQTKNSRVYSLLTAQAKMQTEINNNYWMAAFWPNFEHGRSSVLFPIQSEKRSDSGFFVCDLWKDCIMPSSRKQIREKKERAWSQAGRTGSPMFWESCLQRSFCFANIRCLTVSHCMWYALEPPHFWILSLGSTNNCLRVLLGLKNREPHTGRILSSGSLTPSWQRVSLLETSWSFLSLSYPFFSLPPV